ncbi:MAG: GntR family transcriptional regulator [Lentimicrobiaceae bacterium]|nr:GntR family transcriptional regulator [Lentimicrobiaceae bacterium]
MTDIYTILFNRIIAGEYTVGKRLKEESLATEFNTSRTPIRSILQQLEQDGLIKIFPNKGAEVLPFSADEIEEIYEIRKSLELLCLEISLKNLSLQKLMELKKEIIENTNNEDIQLQTDLDAKLHSYIINSSGKKRLIDMLNQLSRLIQSFRGLGFVQKETKESTIREHIEIIDALCRRDIVFAKEMMSKHIENSKMIALSQLFIQRGK